MLKNIRYKHSLYLADVNYVCVKTVPDSIKIHQIKCKKAKFSGGACPSTPSLSHAKHTDITSSHTLPLYFILSPPPLAKNLKETLNIVVYKYDRIQPKVNKQLLSVYIHITTYTHNQNYKIVLNVTFHIENIEEWGNSYQCT